ncbi:flavodoxin domain-containing protein [Conexibacter sp. CPCC 206217]|uniref:flavodoxin domain-containing protein n=1 Tax=Conexibacter sp. CPCC 206217 TaxID=3064574 RepID=UPI002728C33A|nr:flavodoxin domain-containing protein [Conexibacter sp. CPCC 206217]MDO8213568.1 flavodoxin domain-containing protein [Conexibacter sp. CPCC 206217]
MADTRSIEPLEEQLNAARSGTVLVVHASRNGATRGVAQRIAERLQERGRPVDLRAADELADFTPYDAVVLGSAIYDRSWLPRAETLVRRNLGALAGRPVWLFSLGSIPDTRPLVGRLAKHSPKGIRAIEDAIRPRGYRVFGGVIRREQWPWYGRLLVRATGGHVGDNRDWDEIDAWAAEISRALRAA